ncbi:killer cell lectin-like receptor subfamily B member 1B allele B isoform X2 [Pelodiscus sinensis]|uniref:killer cell lectin-like receptor subfamily B member 1B allele B isoform X2 n=1 Tax=Pelodiscus sinensis TaxID=13735 RepID=UPI003F6A55D2
MKNSAPVLFFVCFCNQLANNSSRESPPCPRWHGVALKAGSAGLLLLLVTVTGLSVSVLQGFLSKAEKGTAQTGDGGTPSTSNGSACNASLEDLVSRLKQSLCNQTEIKLGGARCKLCPQDWLMRGDTCYWLSKESNTWSKSRDDCAQKGSQMLVIQDQEHMGHLQLALPEVDPVWIGLAFNSSQGRWTWLDSAPVHKELFPGINWAEQNSCGVLTRTKIDLETCRVQSKWLCQKDAFLL